MRVCVSVRKSERERERERGLLESSCYSVAAEERRSKQS